MRMVLGMSKSTLLSPTSGSRNPSPFAKRAANLTLSKDVLEAAKRLNFNLSQIFDAYLRGLMQDELERRWREEHADFISAYNASIEVEALLLSECKCF